MQILYFVSYHASELYIWTVYSTLLRTNICRSEDNYAIYYLNLHLEQVLNFYELWLCHLPNVGNNSSLEYLDINKIRVDIYKTFSIVHGI